MQRTTSNGTGLPNSKKLVSDTHKHKSRKNDNGHFKLRENTRLQPRRNNATSPNTGAFNTVGLTFNAISGYDILREKSEHILYCHSDKIRAYMLYCCLRHLPAFKNKMFYNVNDAVNHVYKQSNLLLSGPWGFISTDGDKTPQQLNDIPAEYHLQVCYEEYAVDNPIWGSIKGVQKIKDQELKNVVFMCLHQIIYRFNFSYIDAEGGMLMDFQSWVESEQDNISSCLEDAYKEFEKEFKRPYNAKTDKDFTHALVVEILEQQQNDKDLDYCVNQRTRFDETILATIRSIGYNQACLETYAAKTKNHDLREWIAYVIEYTKEGFYLPDYTAEAYRDEALGELYDDYASSPVTAVGYTYDSGDIYAECMINQFNELAGNCTILPFSTNMTINPDNGKIFRTKDIDVMDHIYNLLDFKLDILKYNR